MFDFRLIIDPPFSGAQNMAIDEALLLDAVEDGIATLRFYSWNEPTLSLGYFQRYDDRFSHPASRDCAIVRRQTGGGAILHDREVTYSITLPSDHRFAQQSEQLYAAVHDTFIDVLSGCLTPRDRNWHLSRCGDQLKLRPNEEPFLCFQRRARGDVLVTSKINATAANLTDTDKSSPGAKILGSAQRRHRGAILQHGSLLLEKSSYAPELFGWRDLTGNQTRVDDLIDRLTVRLIEALDVVNSLSRFNSFELQSKVQPIANSKYGSATWTKRR